MRSAHLAGGPGGHTAVETPTALCLKERCLYPLQAGPGRAEEELVQVGDVDGVLGERPERWSIASLVRCSCWQRGKLAKSIGYALHDFVHSRTNALLVLCPNWSSADATNPSSVTELNASTGAARHHHLPPGARECRLACGFVLAAGRRW